MKYKDKVIKTHSFSFDPKNNGGESFILTTKCIANGDPGGIFLNQELTLQSYGNSATFNLCGTTLTPSSLRVLANQLDIVINEAMQKCKKK